MRSVHTARSFVLPQAVAFATIAGLPPEYGLICGDGACIVAALWGRAGTLVSGPTTAISYRGVCLDQPLAEPGSPQLHRLVLTC